MGEETGWHRVCETEGMNQFPFLFAFAAVTALFATGCECTMVGCAIGADEGVDVTVTGAAKTFATSMPVTFHVCSGGKCDDLTMRDENGTIVCNDGQQDSHDGACFVGADDVELVLVADMPGDTAEVTLTIKDGAGTVLFDDSTTVQVAAYEPNGAMCGPSCRTSAASFNPGPASQ